MSDSPKISRRTVLLAGAGGLLAAASGVVAAQPAQAASSPLRTGREATTITEIGPGILQYSLMSGVVLDGISYIGSRNLEPTGIIAFDIASGTVVHSTTLATGHSIQALAVDPVRKFLYAGILQKAAGGDNLYRWDLSDLGSPAVAIGKIGDRDVRDLAVSSDGTLFAVGGGGTGAPALWQYTPATGAVTSLGAGCEGHARQGGRRDRCDRVLRGRQHTRRGLRRQPGGPLCVRPRFECVLGHHAGRHGKRPQHP